MKTIINNIIRQYGGWSVEPSMKKCYLWNNWKDII